MWVSLAVVILGVVFDNLSELRTIIDERYYGSILIFIGIIMAILRYYTTDEQ
jgi:hypothetical protein